jgi:hypothetical protein
MEQRGLRPCKASKPPHRINHTFDEALLNRPHGRELCPNLVPETLKGLRVLAGNDDVTGEEAVPERVVADRCFPSGVFGPVERRAIAWFAVLRSSLIVLPSPVVGNAGVSKSFKVTPWRWAIITDFGDRL